MNLLRLFVSCSLLAACASTARALPTTTTSERTEPTERTEPSDAGAPRVADNTRTIRAPLPSSLFPGHRGEPDGTTQSMVAISIARHDVETSLAKDETLELVVPPGDADFELPEVHGCAPGLRIELNRFELFIMVTGTDDVGLRSCVDFVDAVASKGVRVAVPSLRIELE